MANVLHRTTKQYLVSVNTPEYSTDDWLINPDLSSVQGVPKKYWKIVDDEVQEMSSSEKEDVDNNDLPNLKQVKISDIDLKTHNLISAGFSFDGHTFSLSSGAQFNWNSLKVAVDGGLLTSDHFPYEISTADHDSYQLQWSDVNTFMGLVLTTVAGHLATGRHLKKQVLSATTKAELDAIIDDR